MLSSGHVHVIGAGLAGLSCALSLTDNNTSPRITLYDMGRHAGGRCRSFYDSRLDAVIDNGNHLVLSGNIHTMEYIAKIGAKSKLQMSRKATIPFYNVADKEYSQIGFPPDNVLSSAGIFSRKDMWTALRLLALPLFGHQATVGEICPVGRPSFEGFWRPLTLAVLNAEPNQASAMILRQALMQTVMRGSRYCRASMARDNLSETFIDPAVRRLKRYGVDLRFNQRLKAIDCDHYQAKTLGFVGQNIAINDGDNVVLALPHYATRTLLPTTPSTPAHVEYRDQSIVNIHFRRLHRGHRILFIGILSGLSHWVFCRHDIISVTISAAENAMAMPRKTLIARVWSEVNAALKLNQSAIPKHRVIVEKRATFFQNPDSVEWRAKTRTDYANIVLAGDWTATGLPASIEGAIISGKKAAKAILKARKI